MPRPPHPDNHRGAPAGRPRWRVGAESAQNVGMHPAPYLSPDAAPGRADIDTTRGPLLLEFGTGWCGHCRAAQPAVAQADHPGVPHLRVEDGPGRALGRSFGVTLWPTLVFLHDGQERQRLVRPREAALVGAALQALNGR